MKAVIKLTKEQWHSLADASQTPGSGVSVEVIGKGEGVKATIDNIMYVMVPTLPQEEREGVYAKLVFTGAVE